MNPELWRRVEELYHAALEREASEREAFVERECAGDPALLREVSSLLRADQGTERFIEQRADEVLTQAPSVDESPSWLGRRGSPRQDNRRPR